MNAWHRKGRGGLSAEAEAAVDRMCAAEDAPARPFWGADCEDSKTPMHGALLQATANLLGCYDGTLGNGTIEASHTAVPVKRHVGLALPAPFLFTATAGGADGPMPLHLYDFALHMWHAAAHAEALTYYVPKLETEAEAAYIHAMIAAAEGLVVASGRVPGYALGTVRVLVVLENPRIMFRVNEVMDALHPYFAGASLGWHDYLASTARLYKNDPHYRIPVKADPDIVVKHIRLSHEVLAHVVGPLGGIKIGGMYGVLPRAGDQASLDATMTGFVRDVVTQLRRGLSGFWVAHPDFVRVGIALATAVGRDDGSAALLELIGALIQDEGMRARMVALALRPAEPPLLVDATSPRFGRLLLAADMKESDVIANNDPAEIEYNVFQAVQYLADWLVGNGCVALPARTGFGSSAVVRVMDDLATTERSRWEVWLEVAHGRFAAADVLVIIARVMNAIRRGESTDQKEVQIQWNSTSAPWYPVAARVLTLLMLAERPAEFVTELLLPVRPNPGISCVYLAADAFCHSSRSALCATRRTRGPRPWPWSPSVSACRPRRPRSTSISTRLARGTLRWTCATARRPRPSRSCWLGSTLLSPVLVGMSCTRRLSSTATLARPRPAWTRLRKRSRRQLALRTGPTRLPPSCAR